MTAKTTEARVIRMRGTESYAYESDDGELDFGPLGPDTLLFAGGSERLYSNMSAAPGGHEAVEEVPVRVTFDILGD